MRFADYYGNITYGRTGIKIAKYGPEWLSKEMILT